MRSISTRSIPVADDHLVYETTQDWRGCIRKRGAGRGAPANYQRRNSRCRCGGCLFQRRSASVQLRNRHHGADLPSDIAGMRTNWAERDTERSPTIPWALEMTAVSVEDPSRLVKTLTGGILGCGGWVLSRGASDSGTVNMLFEFERQSCLDIYSVLIAAGLEINQNGHIRFTELCQCTRSQTRECGTEIASVDLEIQTYPIALSKPSRASEAV